MIFISPKNNSLITILSRKFEGVAKWEFQTFYSGLWFGILFWNSKNPPVSSDLKPPLEFSKTFLKSLEMILSVAVPLSFCIFPWSKLIRQILLRYHLNDLKKCVWGPDLRNGFIFCSHNTQTHIDNMRVSRFERSVVLYGDGVTIKHENLTLTHDVKTWTNGTQCCEALQSHSMARPNLKKS